ncbi:MAG: hypothetical protein M3Y87_02150 [Myxococcota bacterium]|nr:hypothetical protein [Myxococcota bacterium]
MSEDHTTLADVAEGVDGALWMLSALVTPGLRHQRSIWGATDEEAARAWPGDELVPEPRWGWHHAIEITAPASAVWPWVVQIGVERAGFYSYEALENLVGCHVHNAERIHPEWQELRVGDGLRLHPKMPPLPVQWVEPGRGFVVGVRVEAGTQRMIPSGEPLPREHLAASWLFAITPLGDERSRFVSRYRISYGDDLATRISMGPTLVEPIGTVMDQRMLAGVRERAEGALRAGRDARPSRG